jgi:hypothetical protein
VERDLVPRTLAGEAVQDLTLSVGGKSLAAADRERLLADLRAGTGPTRLTVEALVFVQRETPNRNFVRFKPGILKRLAKSFVGMPFLRDHDQRDLTARGGTIVASELVDDKAGPAILQRIELVKPWAIEAALDGTMDRFSIGWSNTADVECSECGEALHRSLFGAYPSCSHMPGDEVEGKDGETRVVEMVVTGAEGVETSAVNVPAVAGTGVEAIRAQLAAGRVRAALAVNHKETPMTLFAKLAPLLALAADAGEDAAVAAVNRLRADSDAARSLHAAELAAHGETKKALAAAEERLAAAAKVERDAAIAGLARDVEAKLGKGEQGQRAAAAAIKIADATTLADARAFVDALPKLSPVGEPMQSRGTAPSADGERRVLTDQQKRVNKRLGIADEEFAKWQTAKEA